MIKTLPWLGSTLLVAALGCGGSGDDTKAASGSGAGTTPAKSETPKSAAVDMSKTGSIKGTVKYQGPKMEPPVIKMDADPKCKEMHPDPVPSDTIVIDKDGNVQWSFVYVKELYDNGTSFGDHTTPVVLNQKGCHYDPHIIPLLVNQPLKILSSDPLMHNINVTVGPKSKNKSFNEAQPVPGEATAKTKTFTSPELAIKAQCDVHTWMRAYIFVMPNPCFAVSGATGEYEIKGCPAGEYTLVAWHEKLGEQTQKVKVDAGGTATANIEYKK